MSTTAYASDYQRDRVCEVRLYASEKRPLVANFVGILGVVPSISSAVWETLDNNIVAMSGATIDGNVASVIAAAVCGGIAAIRCTVSLDSGARYVQQFVVSVEAQPVYSSDVLTAGPTSITATATVGGGTGGGGDGDILDGGGA